MTLRDTAADPHRETLENIPWLVTGRLDAAATARAQQHLGSCAECQSEFDLQCALRATIAAAPAIDHAPAASRAKLESRIAELERELPFSGESAATPPAPRAFPASGGPRKPPFAGNPSLFSLRPVLLAQSAAIVLLALLAGYMALERWEAPRFVTATSGSAPRVAGPVLRIVLTAPVPVREFESLLQAQGARVVDGPTPEHAWTIALPAGSDAASRERTLAALRADARIAFAEPVPEAASR